MKEMMQEGDRYHTSKVEHVIRQVYRRSGGPRPTKIGGWRASSAIGEEGGDGLENG